ncbi:hypothetical protein RclHR1_07690021 [Rhizophagus clarus]|uniref:Uncharacterized protein n=1 Tax=Rhizophagus clarus TaxID=94130 RepID=A0A2Z6SLJ6_9GLOM|nr:hypothetical protein RclHR1_07690021 [Rhizophagus clarus]
MVDKITSSFICINENIGIIIEQSAMLPDEKHDRTFGIKVREVLPDKMHDRTFGIKCCQMKSMTELLELSVAR